MSLPQVVAQLTQANTYLAQYDEQKLAGNSAKAIVKHPKLRLEEQFTITFICLEYNKPFCPSYWFGLYCILY
jgi:hypothetical protein